MLIATSVREVKGRNVASILALTKAGGILADIREGHMLGPGHLDLCLCSRHLEQGIGLDLLENFFLQ